jgi:SAM-dependent methyltransferase
VSASDLQRWNEKYTAKGIPTQLVSDAWLVEQVGGLPPGRGLELACGLGHNAIWLAQQGWQVDALDVSPVGLSLAQNLARANHASVHWIAADLDEFFPETDAYDLVFVFRFLDRARLPGIIQQALKPGGRLLYETFTTTHLARPDSHMKNPAFALAPGELPRLFPACEICEFAECTLPDRDVARLVARKMQH